MFHARHLWHVLVQQQLKHSSMLRLSDGWKRQNVSRETPPCYDWATLLWLDQHTCINPGPCFSRARSARSWSSLRSAPRGRTERPSLTRFDRFDKSELHGVSSVLCVSSKLLLLTIQLKVIKSTANLKVLHITTGVASSCAAPQRPWVPRDSSCK